MLLKFPDFRSKEQRDCAVSRFFPHCLLLAQQRDLIEVCAEEMTSTHVLGVLDLTFLDIREESDLQNGLNLRLTALSATSPPRPSTAMVPTDSPGSPSRKRGRKTFKAIRLSNNYLISADIIYNCIKDTFDVSRILWLDLSFNTITTIGEEFAKNFVNITTVQLHANKIYKLKEVRNICACTNLKALSLYGNPIEEHKHYRNYILYHCPKLTQFDMSPVTKSEVQRMEIWSQTFRKKLHPEEYEE